MIHLTMTGFEAGRILCGAARVEADTHVHAAYAPDKMLASADMCAECLAIWTAPECSCGEEVCNRHAGIGGHHLCDKCRQDCAPQGACR